MCWIVYILYSPKLDQYYKGHTGDLSDRLVRHNGGREKSTKAGVPWTLVWYCEKPDKSSAAILEIKLKNLSRPRLEEFMKKYPISIAGPDIPAHEPGYRDADSYARQHSNPVFRSRPLRKSGFFYVLDCIYIIFYPENALEL